MSRSAAHTPAAAAMGVAIDPVKLFKQYFWWLVGAGVFGIALGVGAHYALLISFPFYRSEVVFELSSQITDVSEITTTVSNNEAEIERFIGGQVFLMTSESLLQQAIADNPSIRNDTEWAKKYISKGTGLHDTDAMLEDIQDIVSARSVPDSNIVLLRAKMHDPNDAATIVKAVQQTYVNQLDRQTSSEAFNILEALTGQINAVREERRLLEDRMRKILADNQVTSLDDRTNMASAELNYLLPFVGEIRRGLEIARDQLKSYEEQLAAPGGATYPEMVRAEVKLHPLMQRFEVQIADFSAALRSATSRLGESNMQTKQLKQNIQAMEEQMKLQEERLLEETFIRLIEMTRSQIRSFEAAEIETQASIAAAELRLAELKTISEDYVKLQADQDRLAEQESLLNTSIANQNGIMDRKASNRVKVQYEAEVPDKPIFPQIIYVVPSTMILIVGVMGGLIVLREVLEQRVRTPQDITLIPHARVLGVIPDVSEDPTKPAATEHAVRDHPAGVVAESIRQIRTSLLKQFTQRGHKALLVVGGLPGSGASSLVCNLASSLAAIDLKVLVIDGNFRRPALHKYFGIAEGPGLGNVLLDPITLADAVQSTDDPHVHVLTAGEPGSRHFERFITASMSRLLDEARASYDIVLVDSPPAIVAGDAMALANRCDAALLVVRAYGEKRGLIARLRTQLEESRADMLGVVLNAARSSAGGYFRRNIRVTHKYQNGLAKDLDAARIRRLPDETKAV